VLRTLKPVLDQGVYACVGWARLGAELGGAITELGRESVSDSLALI